MLRKKPTNSLVSYILAFCSGAGLTFAYSPFNWWWICLVSFSVFFVLLEKSKNKFKTGLVFGLGWFGAGISWVHVSIAEFGGLPLIASIGLMLLLVSYLALYPAIFSQLSHYIKPTYWPMCLPFVWLIVEWVRSWLLTGFPWLSVGYSQTHGPLSGFYPLIGEQGVSALIIAITSTVAIFLLKSRLFVALAAPLATLMVGIFLSSISWVNQDSRIADIALIQGNIEQSLKWQPEQEAPTIEKYRSMSRQHYDADIIIWPEAAIPKLEPLAIEQIANIDQDAENHQIGLITGIVNYNFETEKAYNTLLSLGKQEENQSEQAYRYLDKNRYDKHHLLPIGEFIPLENWLRGIAPLFDLPMSSFSRGDEVQSNLLSNGFKFAPAICFEIVFPEQIRANLEQQTDFILTVSNDAWFGNSHGPHQHMQIAQVRAREFGIPVIRSTNNGVTAIVDHLGKIHAQIPQFEDGVLRSQISTVSGHTPFRLYGMLPLWFITLSLFVIGLMLSRRRKRIFY